MGPIAVVGASLTLLGAGLLPGLAPGPREALLISAVALATVVPLAGAYRKRRVDPIELGIAVTLVYFALFPVRAAVLFLDLDEPASGLVFAGPDRDLYLALASLTLGLVAGGLAYNSGLGRALGARTRLPLSRAVEESRMQVAIPLFFVGLIAQAIVLGAYHWPERLPLVENRTSGIISSATVFMIVGLCLLARRAALDAGGPRVVFALAVLITIAVGVAGQFKEVALVGLLVPLIMWNFTGGRRVRRALVAVTAATALFVIVPTVNVWRHTSARIDSTDPIAIAQQLPAAAYQRDWLWDRPRRFRPWTPLTESLAVASHRLYGFDSFTLAVRYTGTERPFQGGATLVNLAAGFVPRILWPEKPSVGIGYWFAQNYWESGPGGVQVPQAVTHPGNLWIDFGLPGVVIGLALLGIFYRFAFTALRPDESGTGALFYTIVFVTVIVVDRDLPLVYVTLVQRLVATALLLVAVAGVMQLLGRKERSP